jgi:hypothetical protein
MAGVGTYKNLSCYKSVLSIGLKCVAPWLLIVTSKYERKSLNGTNTTHIINQIVKGQSILETCPTWKQNERMLKILYYQCMLIAIVNHFHRLIILFFTCTLNNPNLQCKTNTIPILMHQMRISTNKVSSVVLRPKKLEIRKKKFGQNCKRAEKTKQCHELEQIRRRIELCMREIILRFKMKIWLKRQGIMIFHN